MNRPQIQYIQDVIRGSGTIIANKHWQYFFETSGMDRQKIETLHNCLAALANACGGQVYRGHVHPLTKSRAMLMIDVRSSDGQDRTNQARAVNHLLLSSGNTYVVDEAAIPNQFALASQSTGPAITPVTLNNCKRVIYYPQGNHLGHKYVQSSTLFSDVADAIAVQMHVVCAFHQRATLPTQLFDLDPVKGHAVKIILDGAAAKYKETYEFRAQKAPDGVSESYYLINGERTVAYFEQRAQGLKNDPLGDRIVDVENETLTLSSRFRGGIVPADSGQGILEMLGAGHEVPGASIEGISLMGGSPNFAYDRK